MYRLRLHGFESRQWQQRKLTLEKTPAHYNVPLWSRQDLSGGPANMSWTRHVEKKIDRWHWGAPQSRAPEVSKCRRLCLYAATLYTSIHPLPVNGAHTFAFAGHLFVGGNPFIQDSAGPVFCLNGPHTTSVFEIKGAPWTRRAQFRCRAHDFRHYAPDVCTFFQPILIHIHWGVHWENLRPTLWHHVRPRGPQIITLISNTARQYSKLRPPCTCIFWLPGAWVLNPVHPPCACIFKIMNILNTFIYKCAHEKIAGCIVLSICAPGVCME